MDTLLFFAPMALGVFGNICYNVFARSIPDEADTFASLTITYITGMILAVPAAAILKYLIPKIYNVWSPGKQ